MMILLYKKKEGNLMESILLGAIIVLLIGFFYVVNQYWKENLRTKIIKAGIAWRSPRKYTKPKKKK